MAMCVMAVVGVAPCASRPAGTNYVTRPNLLDRTAPALDEATASRHDEGLTQRVGMPRRASAWLEHDTDNEHACRLGWLEQGINPYSPGEIFGWPFAGGL